MSQTPPSLDFEAAVRELEALVEQMEGGELPLDQALASYRRGSELLKACRDRLAEVRQQVQILDGDLLRDFDATGVGPSADD